MRVLFPVMLLLGLAVALPVRGDDLISDRPSLRQGPIPIETFVGETLIYDIAFLWFDRLAQGQLSLERGEQPHTYRAILEARTRGVAAWVTKDRVQRYVSEMEMGPDGRLRSLIHEAQIIKGKGEGRKDRTNRYTYDYRHRQVRYQRAREGRFYKEATFPMTQGEPLNDVLTAFFNFRTGVYGPIRPGTRYTLPTFSREGAAEIVVEVLTRAERPEQPFFPSGGLLCRVILDPEVFDTAGGAVYVWFDDYGRPVRGIVENIAGLGDVRGTLRK